MVPLLTVLIASVSCVRAVNNAAPGGALERVIYALAGLQLGAVLERRELEARIAQVQHSVSANQRREPFADAGDPAASARDFLIVGANARRGHWFRPPTSIPEDELPVVQLLAANDGDGLAVGAFDAASSAVSVGGAPAGGSPSGEGGVFTAVAAPGPALSENAAAAAAAPAGALNCRIPRRATWFATARAEPGFLLLKNRSFKNAQFACAEVVLSSDGADAGVAVLDGGAVTYAAHLRPEEAAVFVSAFDAEGDRLWERSGDLPFAIEVNKPYRLGMRLVDKYTLE